MFRVGSSNNAYLPGGHRHLRRRDLHYRLCAKWTSQNSGIITERTYFRGPTVWLGIAGICLDRRRRRYCCCFSCFSCFCCCCCFCLCCFRCCCRCCLCCLCCFCCCCRCWCLCCCYLTRSSSRLPLWSRLVQARGGRSGHSGRGLGVESSGHGDGGSGFGSNLRRSGNSLRVSGTLETGSRARTGWL